MRSAINCVGTHKGNIFKITVFIFEEHPYAYGFGIFIPFFSIKKKREMGVEENRLGLVECMMRLNISFL